ncbi:MAG: ParB/RepB/Spo0J family partition protein [Candidatus Lokiarchaeota archaeon]
MKIKLSKIKHSKYDPREKIEVDYIDELAKSIESDGLWNPILVKKLENGDYEVISGGHRLRAVKKLGWDEIEAKLLDVEEDSAAILSIKTNFLQKNLTDIEEAKAIKKIIDDFGYNQKEVAEKLGKSQTWVSNRLALILDVSKKVQEALKNDKISTTHAVIISKLDKKNQDIFLDYILEKSLNINDAREALSKFQNQTIFTIGYQGKDLDTLLKILQDNKINLLIDIRDSGKSTRKPEFSSEVLTREFEKLKINYVHKPELGVIYQIRAPYIEGYISDDSFRGWYDWHLKNIEFDLDEFIRYLKDNGKCCLMCMEEFAKPNKTQKHYCHRDLLARKILSKHSKEIFLNFEKRIDL